jgi:hypothetical protein
MGFITKAAYSAIANGMDSVALPLRGFSAAAILQKDSSQAIRDYLAEADDAEWNAEQDGLRSDATKLLAAAKFYGRTLDMTVLVAALTAVVEA